MCFRDLFAWFMLPFLVWACMKPVWFHNNENQRPDVCLVTRDGIQEEGVSVKACPSAEIRLLSPRRPCSRVHPRLLFQLLVITGAVIMLAANVR